LREIILDDGKYRFWAPDPPDDFQLFCERYGEPWRDFVGDNAVHALFEYAVEQRKEVNNPKATKTL